MPGNTISINKREELTWYVGDSKMKRLIKLLNKVGMKISPRENPVSPVKRTDLLAIEIDKK